MGLYKGKVKAIGMSIMLVIGLLVLFFNLFLSRVDNTVINTSRLEKFNADWTVITHEQVIKKMTFPAIMTGMKAGDTLVLEKKLPTVLANDTYLFFRATHQFVKVKINDRQVYQFGWDEERSFGKSPACTWVVIPVLKEQAGNALKIELTGAYDSSAKIINNIYMGDKSAIFSHIIGQKAGSIAICFVLLILGISMIVIALVLRNGEITVSLFRLGVLSVVVSLWSACVTNAFQIIYGNVFALLNLEFFLFHLILPTTLWFLISFDYYKQKKIVHLLFWISFCLFLVVEVLQITNLADYMETISYAHLLMGITVCYLSGIGFLDLWKQTQQKEGKLLTISLLILFLCGGTDIVRFYIINNQDEGFFTRIGMLIFIVLWAVLIIREMSKLLVKMTETQLLKVLAYEDSMTGLKNRTAFEEQLIKYRNYEQQEEIYLIVFDVNDLKLINDSMGHAQGDQVIKGVAGIIKKEFERIGTCFRIGGDEICVIAEETEDITETIIQKKLVEIEHSVQQASRELQLNFSVAAGYSKLSAQENNSIDYIYREADRQMYDSKQRMKNKNKRELKKETKENKK